MIYTYIHTYVKHTNPFIHYTKSRSLVSKEHTHKFLHTYKTRKQVASEQRTHTHTQILAHLQDPKAGRQWAKNTHKYLHTYKTRKQVTSEQRTHTYTNSYTLTRPKSRLPVNKEHTTNSCIFTQLKSWTPVSTNKQHLFIRAKGSLSAKKSNSNTCTT